MISDDLARQLHDRATRGESLSADDWAQLKDWYALQDSAESSLLGLTVAGATPATLQAHVDVALAQLMTVTKRIQEVAAENKALRSDIAALRRQLAHQPVPQPA